MELRKMKSKKVILLSITLLYVVLYLCLIVTISISYTTEKFNITLKGTKVAGALYPHNDYINIKAAGANYMLGNYGETEHELSQVKNNELTEYNTLMGHLKMQNNEIDDARIYYQKALNNVNELYALTHLINTMNNRNDLVKTLSESNTKFLYENAEKEEQKIFANSVIKVYYQGNEKEKNQAQKSEFKLDDYLENKEFINEESFVDIFFQQFIMEDSESLSEKNSRDQQEQEHLEKITNEARDFLAINQVNNEETYTYLIKMRLSEESIFPQYYNFEILNREVEYLYNGYSNKTMAEKLINTNISKFNNENEIDIFTSYQIIAKYYRTKDKSIAISDVNTKIKSDVLKKELQKELDRIEIYLYSKTHSPKETAKYFQIEVEAVVKIIEEFANSNILFSWELK